MPAVNPPFEPTQGNVTWTLAPRGPLRLLFNISVAIAALSLALALSFAARSKRIKRRSRQVSGLLDEKNISSQRYVSGIWGRSRGVSNGVVTIMSANQRPSSSELEAGIGHEQKSDKESAPWSLEAKDGVRMEDHRGNEMVMAMRQHLESRPAPPPPLTPPTLSTAIFPFEDRRLTESRLYFILLVLIGASKAMRFSYHSKAQVLYKNLTSWTTSAGFYPGRRWQYNFLLTKLVSFLESNSTFGST
ncbi:uncharacterized protein JN550_002898 [Neoarthrinium moseri]|uniref:uncharacterized protein n=1 Tax=Neoarthrinium moseri TaxID=1658444 RepID=UPI001FDD2C83|nr:uncharacterized protein JN550_002898 [Neoarthrinium moseri]KAI1874319.1 hypothetical protein JN550_002898 [Neoarthrinium moseri]